MRIRHVRAVGVAAALCCSSVLVPAARAVPLTDGPWGGLCGFTATHEPGAELILNVAELDGGPLFITEVGTASVLTATGSLRCTIQVDGATHGGADAAAAAAHGAAVVNLSPTTMAYQASWYDDIFLCTEVAYDSGYHLYFDAANDAWSTSSSVACDLVIAAKYEETPPTDGGELDSMVCPVLATVFPSEGDIPGIWDCPPYNASQTREEDQGGTRSHKRWRKPGGLPANHQPYHPTGTIEISSPGAGQITVSYTGFTPALVHWDCTITAATATCTPPPAPPKAFNVCGAMGVRVTNNGGGIVNGSSRCTGGSAAEGTSFGPTTTPTTGSGEARSDFPWVCEATPAQSLPGPWSVQCTVRR